MQSAVVINENIKQGNYDLRTENIGIKPGNTFKATYGDGANIQPNNLLRDGNQQRKNEKKCC